jgi:amidase
VTDLAVLLNAIAGADAADRLSMDVYDRSPASLKPATAPGRRYRDFTTFLKKDALKGARLGVLRDFFGGDPEIDALASAAIAQMKALGATLVDVTLDASFLDEYARDGSRRIRRLADYRFRKDWEAYLATLGPNVPKSVARFVELYETDVAKSALPVEASVLDLLKRSLATSEDDPAYKDLIANQLPQASRLKRAVFDVNKVDALVFPYHPTFAAPISNPVEKVADDTFVRAAGRPIAATLAGYGSEGFPGIVVPMGFGSLGLPMGISFMGRPYDDGKILGYAFAYEQASRKRRPSSLMPPLAGEPIGPAR